MSLINRDDAIAVAKYSKDPVEGIKRLPAVDAVPVVRCKDCKHYELDACLKIYQDGNVSNDAWQERKPTDFCSYGERKE